MDKNRGILFLLPDCPGYFTELFYKMGAALKDRGFTPLYASTTPFYEKFKKVDLAKVGKVFYLNQFLQASIDKKTYEHFPINNWSSYASFSRQTYYFGRPLNSAETLKKTKLFFQNIFDDHNVSLLISEGVSNVFLYLAHEQGSSNGIPYFGLMCSRIPYHFNVHLDVVGNEVLRNPKAETQNTYSNAVPEYMKNSKFGGLFDREYSFMSPNFFKEMFQFVFLKKYTSLETGNTKFFLLKVYLIALKRIIANFWFRNVLKVYEKEIKFNPNKAYVVYPLHFYPEASTSILAKYYDGNEFNLIRNIAFSLPERAILVVKEHSANVGNNSRQFYKQIRQLPNVILLDPNYNLKDNLSKYDAVVTLSSTVGFEALIVGVPVFVLGDVFYQKYEGCQKIGSFAELERHMSRINKRPALPQKTSAYDAYYQICYPGSFNYMSQSCVHEENVHLLLAPILEYLEKGEMLVHRHD